MENSDELSGNQNQRVRDILIEAAIAEALPAGTKAVARIIQFVPKGTAVANAHRTWRPGSVGHVHGLPPYPRRDPTAVLPSGIVRVEIEAVERQSGGMSSHFGFEGLFVSILLSLPDGAIWDARAEPAT